MLTLLLSTLGIGGIGALAFFFVPGAAKVMLQVWDWITASKVNLLTAACLALAGTAYWCWHGWEKSEKVLASTEQAYRNAQADAAKAQIALNSSITARYRAEAEKTDVGYQKARAGALDRADSYIARNRVRACPTGPASGPDPAAESGAASVHEVTAAPALVAVAAGDIRACSIAAPYAMKAHEWATGMVDGGLAEWPETLVD